MRNALLTESIETDHQPAQAPRQPSRRAMFELQRSRFDIRRSGPSPSFSLQHSAFSLPPSPPSPPPSSFTIHPSSFPLCPFPIAGFSHYDGARELPSLREGTHLTLRPEPTNPHDPAAVEILHRTAKLGYVPRFCNRHVSHMLTEGVALTCEIARVDPSSPPWEAVAVRLSVADTTADAEAA